MTTFSFAHPFMDVTGDLVMAWMLLWRAKSAARGLAAGAKKKDVGFYEGQIKGAQFFIKSMLPVTTGKMISILGTDSAAVDMSEDGFGGK